MGRDCPAHAFGSFDPGRLAVTIPEQQAEWDRQFAEINAAMKAVPKQAPLWTVPVAALVIAVGFTLAYVVMP